jgi:hypothetical protein
MGSVIHGTVVLKITSLGIAIAAAAIFLFQAPFRLWQKVLFLLGIFPLYEYSVMSRNYGISMLLLFAFCSLYARRFQRILILAGLIFLMAQASLHSLIMAASLAAALLAEYGFRYRDPEIRALGRAKPWLGFGIMALGFILALIQIYPDHTTVVTNAARTLTLPHLLAGAVSVAAFPGKFFPLAFGIPSLFAISIIIWLAWIYFLRRPFIFIPLFLGITGIGTVFAAIYYGSLRHQGFAYLLIVAAFWMENAIASPTAKPVAWRKHFSWIFLLVLLGFQVKAAVDPVRNDLRYPFSSSQAFARFIQQHPEYHDAIIMGEPDYYLEALPYYLDNPLYFAREKRFGKTILFTTQNQEKLSLAELLEAGQRLKASQGKPVLIELGHRLSSQGPWFRFWFSFHKLFEYDPASWETFQKQTKKVAEFRRALCDERYGVYEVK